MLLLLLLCGTCLARMMTRRCVCRCVCGCVLVVVCCQLLDMLRREAYMQDCIDIVAPHMERENSTRRDALFVAVLRSRLHRAGGSTTGTKPELFARLYHLQRDRYESASSHVQPKVQRRTGGGSGAGTRGVAANGRRTATPGRVVVSTALSDVKKFLQFAQGPAIAPAPVSRRSTRSASASAASGATPLASPESDSASPAAAPRGAAVKRKGSAVQAAGQPPPPPSEPRRSLRASAMAAAAATSAANGGGAGTRRQQAGSTQRGAARIGTGTVQPTIQPRRNTRSHAAPPPPPPPPPVPATTPALQPRRHPKRRRVGAAKV